MATPPVPTNRPFPVPGDPPDRPYPVAPQNILSTAIIRAIGGPPRPLPQTARIANSDGSATHEFHLFLTQQYEWQIRLLSALSTPPP